MSDDSKTIFNYKNKYDHVNPAVLKHMLSFTENNLKVLDVGCWSGGLGKALQEENRTSYVIDGIDIDNKMLSIAKKEAKYRNVYNLDLNNKSEIKKITEIYDVLVLGDVLEHTVEPEKTLSYLLPKLKRGGYVVVSLPNIAFIKYRLTHLLGNWNYTNTGIMDKTHLKFFTLDTMLSLFSSLDLEVLEYKGVTSVLGLYNLIQPLTFIYPKLFAIQFVFKLQKRN